MTEHTMADRLSDLLEELNRSKTTHQQDVLETRLEHRARQYAAPVKQQANYAEADIYNVLVFTLGEERYGVDVKVVRSVRQLTHVTRVPGSPAFYRGVVNVRGSIITLLDLHQFFNHADNYETAPHEMIVCTTGDLQLGILAHHVEEVRTIPRDQVEYVDMTYARGVTRERIVILDIDTLFSDERLIIGGEADA